MTRIWRRPVYIQALKSLGVDFKEFTNNVELDKLLNKTLQERNPGVEDISDIRNAVYDSAVFLLSKAPIDSPKEEAVVVQPAPVTEPAPAEEKPVLTSECPTFMKAYDAAAAECQDCKDGADVAEYCKQQTAALKAESKKKSAKKKVPVLGDTLKKSYPDFDALVKHLRAAPGAKITMALNKFLLKGNIKLSTLVKKLDELPGNDFKNTSRIKSHIHYMEKQGWQFEWAGAEKDMPRLIGYTPKASMQKAA